MARLYIELASVAGSIGKGFRSLSSSVRKSLVRQTQISGTNVQRVAKQNLDSVVYSTPASPSYKRTGLLKARVQIKFQTNGLAVEVYDDVYYAAFVEFGTGRAGAATIPGDVQLPEDWKYGSVTGMPARPFLFPAWDQERLKFLAAVEKIIRGK